MAQFQGAIFLHTWNDGKLDGLVVEGNTVYWNPPGTVPAILNDAVFQGGNGIFRNNRIYSTSPWIIASNQSLHFEGNQYNLYSHDGGLDGRWSYGGRMFQSFADYQAHSGQDSGSSFRQIVATNTDRRFGREPVPRRATGYNLSGAAYKTADKHRRRRPFASASR